MTVRILLTLVAVPLLAIARVNPPVGAQCEGNLEGVSNLSIAKSRPKILADHSIELVIHNASYESKERIVHLPSAIHWIRTLNNLRVVVLAGNSEPQYLPTRHSLAFKFGEYLQKTLPAVMTLNGVSNYAEICKASVQYEDQTIGTWTATFNTQAPYFRTETGEVFLYPGVRGTNWVVIKMIGHYNEIGDFAAPIIEFLNVDSKHVVLVHENLREPTRVISHVRTPPLKFSGNNAEFSMVRAISYRAVRRILESLEPIQGIDRAALAREFEEVLNVRDADLAPNEIKNFVVKQLAALDALIRYNFKRFVYPVAVDHAIVVANAELAQKKTILGRQMSEAAKDPSRAQEAADLHEQLAKIGREIKSAKDRIASDYEEKILGAALAIARDELSFQRLSFGTDFETRLEGQSMRDFVLSPPPPGIFTDAFWAVFLRELRLALQ